MSEENKNLTPLDEDEELDEVTGGKKKKDKDSKKKFDGPRCLVCMKKTGDSNIRTRKHSNGTWECQRGHKFKGAGNKPNFEQQIY